MAIRPAGSLMGGVSTWWVVMGFNVVILALEVNANGMEKYLELHTSRFLTGDTKQETGVDSDSSRPEKKTEKGTFDSSANIAALVIGLSLGMALVVIIGFILYARCQQKKENGVGNMKPVAISSNSMELDLSKPKLSGITEAVSTEMIEISTSNIMSESVFLDDQGLEEDISSRGKRLRISRK
mmetsp:Transcript_27901/g.32034  ORF Transcript_27901/g.32034 Transcript_27901/m.32034 type:complete len:183 (+) Transcript_27901:282-830(+)